MLLSLVLYLRPLSENAIRVTTGHAVHKAVLEAIGRADPWLGKQLHDGPDEKPFTVSPLFGKVTHHQRSWVVTPEQTYWVRVTSQIPALSRLLRTLSPTDWMPFALFHTPFEVTGIARTPDEHPWAGESDYDTLINTWFHDEDPNPQRLRLEYSTATTFHTRTGTVPLPLPHLMFIGLLEKWLQFAPADQGQLLAQALLDSERDHLTRRFDEQPANSRYQLTEPERDRLTKWFDERLAIGRYQLRTQMLDFERYKQIGFEGTVNFLVEDGTDPAWVNGVGVLADYIFYAGIGYKTTMGMGQARRQSVAP